MMYLSHHALNPSRKTLAASLLLFSLTAPALAQDPSQSPPPAPRIEEEKVTGLNYPNINVRDLLSIYEKLVDRPVLYDESVQGNINLDTKIPVSKAEAKRLIEIAMLANSFSILKREKEILVLGPGKPTRSASVPIYFDEKSIPEGESVISFVFDLKYADPVEMANTLNQYLATGQPYTSFLPLPGGRHLLVTESTSSVRLISELIKKIDVEGYEPMPEVPSQSQVPPQQPPPSHSHKASVPVNSPEASQSRPIRRRVLLPPTQP